MLGFIRRSLVLKLLSLALTMGSAVLLVLLSSHENHLQHYLTSQIGQDIQSAETLLDGALAPALYVEDTKDAIQRTHKMRQALPHISYIAISTPAGDKLAHSGSPVPASIQTLDYLSAVKKGSYHWSFNIELAGKLVGVATIGMDLSKPQTLLQDVARSNRQLSLLAVGLGCLLLGLLAYGVVRRLKRLDRGMQDLIQGKMDTRLVIAGQDESSQLAANFNHMVETIAKRQTSLQHEKNRFRLIAEQAYAWEIWLSHDFELLWSNLSSRRLTGYTPAELLAMDDFPKPLQVGKRPKQNEDSGEDTGPCVWAQLQYQERGSGYECRIRRKDGSEPWVAIYWQPIIDTQGNNIGIRVSFLDVTSRHESDALVRQSLFNMQVSESRHIEITGRLQKQQVRFRALLSAMPLGILFETPKRCVEYVNQAFKEMWGLDKDMKLQGMPVATVLEQLTLTFVRRSKVPRSLLQVVNADEDSEQFEIRLMDGRVVNQVSYPVYDDDTRFMGRLWAYEDITRNKQTAEQLLYLAERDPLTGLCNRHRFQLELSRLVEMAQRHNHPFAILYFDLDEFKYINDTYGHSEGDAVLTRISGELLQSMRKNDVLARVGGDEFAILSPLDNDQEEIADLGHRIVSAVSRISFNFAGKNIRLTASLGIAIYPSMTNDPDTLIVLADTAMYQSKQQGKNTWSIYDKKHDHSDAAIIRMTWAQRIEHGLENDLFELHYQGIYDIRDGALNHLEALVRLRDGENKNKLYLPTQFIPGAEKSGKILAIDRWVLGHVIGLLAKYDNMPDVAVNISGRSFDDPTLAQQIHDWLYAAKVSPRRLIIELTETSAVADIQDARHFIETLHRTGCLVCLDDFGAGFSSFAYLKHIPADIVKIDGQFIYDLHNNPENQIFLRAMLDVAKGLHKTTIAEYVENQSVYNMLKAFGVDMMQGFHADKPQLNHPALPFVTKK